MLDTRLLQAHMVLKGVTTKTFADAQGWSLRKAYRKIKGETAFTSWTRLRRTQFFLRLICLKGQKCVRRSPIPLLQEKM